MRAVYLCEVCDSQHDTPDAAEGCEKRHAVRKAGNLLKNVGLAARSVRSILSPLLTPSELEEVALVLPAPLVAVLSRAVAAQAGSEILSPDRTVVEGVLVVALASTPTENP